MRFAFAHKLSTYLMVLSAFFALALSGELADSLVIAGLGCVLSSWLWEPPRIRFERFSLPWTILSVLILGYAILTVLSGGDFLLVGAQFLLYLLIVKLFNRRACKDYLHVYVTSFLMLVASTVLNSQITFGVCFLAYVICATWALTLFHLRREMEDNFLLKHSDDRSSERVEVARILNSRRIVGRRFFAGTAAASLTIFLAATVMFLAIPRVGFGLFFQKNRGGITMAGFSDGVELGGHGTIKSDTTVVMRVEIDDPYEGQRAPYIHWRGVAFDFYKNGQWRRSRTAPRTARQVVYPGNRVEQYHLLYDRAKATTAALLRRAEQGVKQSIYLEPIGYDVLFGASMPLAFELESKLGGHQPRTSQNDEMRVAHTAGMKYVVYSDIEQPETERLRQAPKKLPHGFEQHYLQVPSEITDETRALAAEITRNAATDHDKAVAVERWLESNLEYTLEMEDPGRQEPIHFFLFERQRGHCEYFSSAMAMLLRLAGVPARNVNGFLGGEWNEYDEYIAVRAGDAHSWVEAYFSGVGWVTFDPTPSGEIDRLGRGGGGVRDRMRRFVDTLRFKWFKWVIEYDLYRQMSLFRSMRSSVQGGATSVREGLGTARDWVVAHARLVIAVIGGIGAVLIAVAWWRRRNAASAGSQERAQRSRDALVIMYQGVQARLARHGYRREAAVTPREHAAALVAALAPGARELGELTELYYDTAYGGRDSTPLLPRARELSATIEQALREARA